MIDIKTAKNGQFGSNFEMHRYFCCSNDTINSLPPDAAKKPSELEPLQHRTMRFISVYLGNTGIQSEQFQKNQFVEET